MAPEILLHRGCSFNPTVQSDIYSFGMALYELMTGERIWQDLTSLEQLVQRVASGERPPLHDDSRLSRLIASCWQHAPSSRPHANEVVEELLEIILHESELAEKLPYEYARSFWYNSFGVVRHSRLARSPSNLACTNTNLERRTTQWLGRHLPRSWSTPL